MNKKGFAITIILYSIIFLIVSILYILLGIVKTRYVVESDLRKNVNDTVNAINTSSQISMESCTITGSSNTYTPNLVLTINVSNNRGILYSFNHNDWLSKKTTSVTHSGIYIGYFKDLKGKEGNCQVDITSKTQYRYRDCKESNIVFGNWYLLESNNDECVEVTKEEAENNYLDEYILCSVNRTVYKRNKLSCSFTDESWSDWSNNKPESTNTRQVEGEMVYKIVQ